MIYILIILYIFRKAFCNANITIKTIKLLTKKNGKNMNLNNNYLISFI